MQSWTWVRVASPKLNAILHTDAAWQGALNSVFGFVAGATLSFPGLSYRIFIT